MQTKLTLLALIALPLFSSANNSEEYSPTSALEYQQTTNTRIVVEDNFLRFFTGGEERMTVDGSGNVGIGGVSSAALLHLQTSGTQKALRLYNASNNAQFNFWTTESNAMKQLRISEDTEGKTVMTFLQNGNVGIGTTTPFSGSGNYGLHVNRGIHSSLLLGDPFAGHGGIVQTSDGKQRVFIGANMYDDHSGSWSPFVSGKGAAGISILADEGGWGTSIDFITSQADGFYNTRMTVQNGGNVGIGTTNPIDKLTLNGGDMTLGNATDHEYNIWFRPSDNYPRSSVIGYSSGNVYNDYIGMKTRWGSIRFITNSGNEVVRITNNQRVGIGTTSPSQKLDVNGNINASKYYASGVQVWPDYVFEDTYELNDIEEVEKYIEKNHHLPEIPSEAEVKENGIDIVDMQARLLKKIEELTLYVIEQNKRLESQQKEIKELKARQ